ncbi:hypothetical protein FEM48_Zijuj06G0080700 [Ziziphus jujuba var. spinosa]|uniref:Uncharacterized protein n=1 Tax=Ziziphus jujuba var. spinosa TaxID=714518 RepID=A0A978V844_ZIZJJ|nr:hypothetical protein FEM48_Zijuj06G0080700 [Ziziphus jujuba var. spinosa]
MKDNFATTAAPSLSLPLTTTSAVVRKESSESGVLGKSGYKFWVLAAILLLAFWSMLTGSVTLKWSAGNLARFSDDFGSLNLDDLDILEREKVVQHMWDLYTHSSNARLPRFWQEAFEAAYEHLASDVAPIRDAAVSEIAKMSIRSINMDPPPVQSTSSRGSRKDLLQAEKKSQVNATEVGNS